jgi:anaerobic magnesium-protoporphyrin IX monomethyl ester cyclase
MSEYNYAKHINHTQLHVFHGIINVWRRDVKMHITLVNPPYPMGSHQHPPLTPLGIGYLATVLEKNQYEVDVIDCQPLKLTHEEFRKEISKRQPNIVGITSTTLTYKSALQIAKISKEVCPNCLTILGGCHATFWDDKALQECPHLDIVVRKEGENTLLELAGRLREGRGFHDVLGITCRDNGEIIRNADRPYIENLDDLPFPAHNLFPLESFRKYGKVIFPVLASRGCVYWCGFCTAVRMFGRKHRVRSPKNVVDELEFLHNTYGAELFTFYDDTFTINQPKTAEICEEIKKRKMKIQWDCETRVDMVTKDLLLKMREAGCFAIWFGLESGSQKVIDAMGKGFALEQAVRAFKWAKEAGLMVVAHVILGFPGETKESAWETVKLVEKLNPDDVGYYIATPYPGTPMYDYVKKMGWLKIHDFDKYDTANPIIETPMLSMKELREIRQQAFRKFYLRPTYVLHMFAKGGVYGFSATRTACSYLLRTIKSKLCYL